MIIKVNMAFKKRFTNDFNYYTLFTSNIVNLYLKSPHLKFYICLYFKKEPLTLFFKLRDINRY
jgi:hypothetical protein